MIAVHPQIRYSSATSSHANDLQPYHLNDEWRRGAQSASEQCAIPLRAQMDPPRPLEPRAHHDRTPSLQAPARLESYPLPVSPVPQQHVRTLPGVRDILSPPQHEYSNPDAWRASQQQQHYQDQRFQQQQQPVFPARPEPYGQQERRVELPILETRHQPVGLAPLPFSGVYIDQTGSRPRQHSSSSYARDSVASPYTPSHEDVISRTSNGPYERAASVIFTPTSADSSRRYIGVQDFPEGQFHVYDDGHKIPTHIEGEHVNPQWGLTKANKPRKRLALACKDCREKKIKCEPGATSCLQCEKAKRVCRRYSSKSAHDVQPPDADHRNTNHSQLDASSATEWSSNAGSPPASRTGASTTDASHPASREGDGETLQKRRAQHEPVAPNDLVKRQKSTSPITATSNLYPAVNGHSALQRPKAFTEDESPFVVNPDLTMHLLNLYFEHINNGVYNLIPQEPFMQWLSSDTPKSQTDRAVLHAMLALASIFDSTWDLAGQHCADLAVASLQAKFGKFSLQLIHVRLILALYTFAKNNKGMAWEHSGAAMRAIAAGRFNNEENCIASTEQHSVGDRKEYGMLTNQAIECRRRTFWCGFMMDRFYGFCEGMLCTFDKADVYLRLPCSDSVFIKGNRSQAPFFDNGIVERADTVLTPSSPASAMAHMALVVSIWGDVMNFINRGIHRSSSGHAAAYEAFYADTYNALQAWDSHLPSHLKYNEQNVLASVRGRYAGEFVTMHALHEAALLKLNRCMRWSLMLDKVPRNICEAHSHANTILEIITALNNTRNDSHTPADAHAHRFSFSTPFIGFAIISAIDVISAGGHDDRLKVTINLMREGLACLRELSNCWQSAADQARDGEKRFFQVSNIVSRPYKASSGCWLGRNWGVESALESEIDPKDDCIYGVDAKIYYAAMNQSR